MELSELKNKICEAFSGSEDDLKRILDIVAQDQSIFPFNEYEYLICHMLDCHGLTFEKYMEIRAEYIKQNLNRRLFELSNSGFGKESEAYVNSKCPSLEKPSKELDPDYDNEYDFWLDGIKVEVKSSRAVNKESKEPLYIRALLRNTNRPFVMNFQQLKPDCCDVFVWVAVFRDEIVLWVQSSNEVSSNPLYSDGQHRGNEREGQLHVTHKNIHMFDKFDCSNANLESAIRDAANRQNKKG